MTIKPQNEPRSCTVCLARDVRRPATHVASDAEGLEWYECGRHDPTDTVTETVRVALEPIGNWLARPRDAVASHATDILRDAFAEAKAIDRRLQPCKHDLACRRCGKSVGEIAIARAEADADPEFDRILEEAANHALQLTTVCVERYGGVHEGVTIWLRGMNVGTLTVSSGEGEPLRMLLLSEGIVAKARVLIRHWKDQDGFNASVVDDLMSEIDLVDSTVEAQRRSEAAS